MKSVQCIYCKSLDLVTKQQLTSPINESNYTLYHCNSCLIEFYDPAVFENVYESEALPAYEEFHKGRTTYPAWTRQIILSLKALNITLDRLRILEIGAGDGINYLALKQLGQARDFDYTAVELDPLSAIQCRRQGIQTIYIQAFDTNLASELQNKFDMVLLPEVLEHQTDPSTFFANVSKVLRTDGIVVITVPNRDRFFLKFREQTGDLPPHHFLRFNTEFFRHNPIGYQPLLIQDYRYVYEIRNVKSVAIMISRIVFKKPYYWLLFYLFIYPLKGVITLLDSIQGDGIIAILSKK